MTDLADAAPLLATEPYGHWLLDQQKVDPASRVRIAADDRQAGVYWCWGADGECLYVGSSSNHPMTRIQNHRQPGYGGSLWWGDVEYVEYLIIGNHAIARAYEEVQIVLLQPTHNILGKSWPYVAPPAGHYPPRDLRA